MSLHGGDIWHLDGAAGHAPGNILDFSANLNPFGLPPSVERLLREETDLARRYPDPDCRDLRQGMGDWLGLPESRIVAGNGASELIREILLALRPRRVGVVVRGPDWFLLSSPLR